MQNLSTLFEGAHSPEKLISRFLETDYSLLSVNAQHQRTMEDLDAITRQHKKLMEDFETLQADWQKTKQEVNKILGKPENFAGTVEQNLGRQHQAIQALTPLINQQELVSKLAEIPQGLARLAAQIPKQ